MSAVFGWQGLSFRHPDDWVPVVLSGDRQSGYARLASPQDLSLQIRWSPLGSEKLDHALDRYLDRLSGDARRRRQSFDREILVEEEVLCYRYRGESHGEGLLFPSGDGRVVFIEALGESGTARHRVVQAARSSFASGAERWSILGLSLTMPAPLRVEKKEFFAGRTALTLVGRGVRVVAERWGLAEGLLARGTLQEWARNRLGKGWTQEEGLSRGCGCIPKRRECEMKVQRPTFFGFEAAIARHQPEQNQITLLRVRSRHPEWRPQWDWLT